jgi:hypothetical protein
LKAEHPALQAGDGSTGCRLVNTDHADKVIAFRRTHEAGSLLILVNFSPYPLDLHIYDDEIAGHIYTDIFNDTKFSIEKGDPIALPGWGYFVLRD